MGTIKEELKQRLQKVLIQEEIEAFDKLLKDALEMRFLLQDQVNRDTRDAFGSLVGQENIPKEWKILSDEEWTERAEKVLYGEENDI